MLRDCANRIIIAFNTRAKTSQLTIGKKRLKQLIYAFLLLGFSLTAAVCKNDDQLTSAPIHACDHLAADLDDPNRLSSVPGVRADALAVEANVIAAIAVCTEAHEKYPDVPRFAYQLARALAAAGMLEDAEPFLINAAENEYAAAFALLGDLSEDTEEATDFYEIAAARGYGPAKKYLQQAAKTSTRQQPNDVSASNP